MARPAPTTAYQEELYSALGPLADQDPGLDWPLLKYCGAIASMFDQINTYARDQPDGTPGWGILLDPDRCPPEMLPWLGQFVGVVVKKQLTAADQRASVKGLAAFKRGSPGALKAAAAQFLTGSKTVYVSERDGGDAYKLFVVTLLAETSSQAAVLAALMEQKPAGILMQYVVSNGYTYDVVHGEFSSYSALQATYATYGGLTAHTPGA